MGTAVVRLVRTLLFTACVAGAALAHPASAQQRDDDRFCPNRPSLGSSGCTTLPGQVQVEVAGSDWTLDNNTDERVDTIRFVDTIARIGVGPKTEFQLGWSPQVVQRTRNKTSGEVSRISGISDLTLAVRQNITHADGHGLSTAVQPFVTLPTGRGQISDGTWSAGAVVPVVYEVNDTWSLGFTAQAAALADEDRHGRHLDASGIVEVGYTISPSVTAFGDVVVERDNDSAQHVTMTQLAGSLAWQPTKRTQLDVLAVAGLNHNTPDLRLALGGAFVF
ncbi:transporter [Sphingomonas sp. RHCKR47]|nr:transporter [Sphingomonas citricola]